jgi:hypothetical protein
MLQMMSGWIVFKLEDLMWVAGFIGLWSSIVYEHFFGNPFTKHETKH